ncbi:MAG: thioredoxin-disulfide reductase [Oscillospiraceae bacterium]|nr:thioredoxin-disulfide reductase [Oscillospiraceae bacterium]
MNKKVYDMLIIGGGPGGYTAALYAARAGLSVAVLEKLAPGGQMAETPQIDNYPGFPDGIDGFTLGQQMKESAQRFGAETVFTQVTGLSLDQEVKSAQTDDGVFYGKTVVVATGAGPRQLNVPGEQAQIGRGVHYCAACDGMFYRNKTVVVVGGGNTAVADALLLSRVAKKVYLVHRRDSLKASKVYHRTLEQTENIEFIWNSQVTEIQPGKVLLKNLQTSNAQEISVDGVFVAIGRTPATWLVKGLLELDEQGYILADESTATNLPGVYAVGDVRSKQLRQIVTAVADGAASVHQAEEYLTGIAG